jgi:glycosyltransferase involved in cell wall biosynthesis
MSLFFDCRFIRVDHHDGISRFSSELFRSISKTTSVTALICDKQQLKELPQGIQYLLVNDPKNALLELLLPGKLNKQGASVVFSPMQTMGSLGRKYKLILTLHDLIYYKHRKPPAFLSLPIRLAWRIFHLSFSPVRFLLNRADAVVTISETSKSLIETNRLTRRSVTVVYNASSMPVVDSPKNEAKTKNLVYMGSFMPYKNVELLIKGMENLPEYTLTLCSKVDRKRRDQLLASASQGVRSRIVFVNGMSESKYLEMLDESFALVTASKDEGFGIPVIEAMSRSIPVVLSDIKIFREVALGAGHYFDPESPSAFALEIKSLDEIGSWQKASMKTLERARAFDWDESAEKLNLLIQSLRS